MFEIGSMNIHYRFFDIEYFFDSCRENQIRKAELWLCPQHFYVTASGYEVDVLKTQKMAERAGVELCCLCPEQNNPKPGNMAADTFMWEKYSMEYFKNTILLAEALRIPQLLLTSGWAYYDKPLEEAWRRSVKHMRELVGYAGKRGIKICIEPLQPHESRLVNNLHSMKEYIADVDDDNLYVALDMGALGKAGESIEEWFYAFGKRIIHIHYVDGNPAGHLPVGMGKRNIVEDMKYLLEAGYEGVLSFEFAGAISFENPREMDRRSKDALQKAIDQAREEVQIKSF